MNPTHANVSAVSVPANLDELLDLIQSGHQSTRDRYGDLSCDLPSFGGVEPSDTQEIWSWDADRLLVGRCADELQIVSRDGEE